MVGDGSVDLLTQSYIDIFFKKKTKHVFLGKKGFCVECLWLVRQAYINNP